MPTLCTSRHTKDAMRQAGINLDELFKKIVELYRIGALQPQGYANGGVQRLERFKDLQRWLLQCERDYYQRNLNAQRAANEQRSNAFRHMHQYR